MEARGHLACVLPHHVPPTPRTLRTATTTRGLRQAAGPPRVGDEAWDRATIPMERRRRR
ncbi:hypothetical protein L083_8105 [Actinoplanes sp. N902-109]|nr:hypothetical protein L083_8105 [Actinoplanes sp. N902-109]